MYIYKILPEKVKETVLTLGAIFVLHLKTIKRLSARRERRFHRGGKRSACKIRVLLRQYPRHFFFQLFIVNGFDAIFIGAQP